MQIRLKANNAGRFISQGHGRHISRIIRDWELIFVVKSRLEMLVGNENFYVVSEYCLLLPPAIRHGGRSAYTPDLSFFWIHFIPVDQESEECLKKLPRCFRAMNPARLSEYFQLFLALEEDSPEEQEERNMLVQLILFDACRKSGEPGGVKELPPLVQQLRKNLFLRFREPLSTTSLAKELQCNPDYLGRIYRQYFNESITDSINRIRINHAAALLQNSSLNIAQIAYEVGFNDPSYFRRRFFRCHAMSPGDYRKLKIKEFVNTE